MLKQHFIERLRDALNSKADQLNLETGEAGLRMLNLERARERGHGDYAVNVSPLAKFAKLPPPEIANMTTKALLGSDAATRWFDSNVVGGFVNLTVNDDALAQSLLYLLSQQEPGKSEAHHEMRCLMEFVSANPTGPLHIGHGRWVALGDSLGRILRHAGAEVVNEFYLNDAGNQLNNLANSLWYRCLEILETGGKLPEPEEGQPYPFYPGEYVIDLARQFLETHREKILQWDSPAHIAPPEAMAALIQFAQPLILAEQKALMTACRLTFDVWFSEKQLHQNGDVENMLATLKTKGVTYEKDGALWFAASRFGDDQDRVLVKSDGNYTYLTADIAYHHNKFLRNNGYFNHFINIWGADHHGYIARMKAALSALGHDPDKLEILLGQLVNLIIDGTRTRMGKRKKMLTLAELVDEVGVDALRFWMVSKSQDTTLDFNVDLASVASDENPVFYAQYAHARCASILRNAFSERLDTQTKQTLPPLIQEAKWQAFLANLSAGDLSALFRGLEKPEEHQALKDILLKLDSFEDWVLEAARQRAPHMLVRYTLELAAEFHHFYAVCRILVPDPQTVMVRLVVIEAIRRVLAQALDLLGVTAPDQM